MVLVELMDPAIRVRVRVRSLWNSWILQLGVAELKDTIVDKREYNQLITPRLTKRSYGARDTVHSKPFAKYAS